MERLEFTEQNPYQAIEGAIHLARYLLGKQICKDKKVLDAACGQGYGSYLLSRWGAKEVCGIDISKEAVDQAAKLFLAKGLTYLQHDIEHLDFIEDDAFDMAISLETIEHLSSPLLFLQELRRVVKPEGSIIISCPNDHFYYPDDSVSNPYHVRKYTLSEFIEMVTSVLGKPQGIFLGTPAAGYINFPFEDGKVQSADQRQMLDYGENLHALTLPVDEAVTEKNSSYFVAVWNVDPSSLETAAIYPNGMDHYPDYEKKYTLEVQTALKNQVQDYKEALDKEKDAVNTLQETMEEYQAALENCKERIDQKDAVIEQYEVAISEVREERNNWMIRCKIAENEKQFIKGIEKIDPVTGFTVEERLRQIYASRSWKLMSKIMRVVDRLKGIKRKLMEKRQ